MSLEEKLAALTMDDVSAVVAAVQKDGVETSGLAANITVLAARCDSSDEAEALAAFKTVKQLAIECPQAQAFTKECLSACTFASGKYTLVFSIVDDSDIRISLLGIDLYLHHCVRIYSR
jgi:hypothetical protein